MELWLLLEKLRNQLIFAMMYDSQVLPSIESNTIKMIAPYTGIKYFQLPEPIPQNRLEKARLLNASHSTKDGLNIYRHKIGTWEYAEWKDNQYGSWWQISELPKDLVLI